MDKYEFNIKVEQIKKLVGKSDYETAMKIADTIDWRRVRNTNLLSMVAMVYEKNEDYEEAKEILLLAFERAPIGKRLLYKLAELALKEGNIDEAEAYYREFSDLAGEDPRQQLLRYMILKAKGAPAQQLIHSLESYVSQEIDEKWLYELAELYSLAGMPDRCVETCDKIMLMFGLGKYVDKAMELKIQYAPLTSYQMDLVENRDKYEAKLRAVEQGYGLGGEPMNEPEQEDEYYEEDNQDMAMPEEPDYGDLAARMQEAEVQEGLAREMSRISYEEPPIPQSAPRSERTRVLDDIRRINRPAAGRGYDAAAMAAGETAAAGIGSLAHTAYGAADSMVSMAGAPERMAAAMPRPHGTVHMAEAEDEVFAEPVVEEDDYYENGPETSYEADEYEESEAFYGDGPYDQVVYEETEQEYEEPQAQEPSCGRAGRTGGKTDDRIPADETAESYDYETEAAMDEEPLEIEDLEEEDEEPPVLNHLMIEARTPEKGLKIAVEALKQIHRETGVKNPVAKITGEKLSKRGVAASAQKLAGKDLVIEEAGDLTPEALEELDELMNRDTTGMIVVLIDNPKQMENLHRSHPRLASKFECIGSGEETGIEEDVIPSAAIPAQEAVRAPRLREPAAGASVRPLYPEHGADMDQSGMQGGPAFEEEEYREEACQEDRFEEPDYEEELPKKKKGLFHNRKKPVYEPLEPEMSDEDDDYYEEEAEDSMPVSYDDGPGSHGEEMDIDEFAQYACRYANEIDCSITGKSMLALYERIEIMEEDGVPLTRVNAEGLIEEAADRAEKPSFGKRVKGIFSSKYDKDGLLILKEEHFIY